jgi:hypothetical protein
MDRCSAGEQRNRLWCEGGAVGSVEIVGDGSDSVGDMDQNSSQD